MAERLGYPADSRLLILHADDLGMFHSVNQATFEALKEGWVTSASILVPCPWFPEVVRFAHENPELDLGIHLALNSEWTSYRWGPVSSRDAVPSLLDDQGYLPLLEKMVVQQASLAGVERELRAQIERARAMGIRITHLDSHMGTLFWTPEFLELYARLGRSYGIPIRIPREDEELPENLPVPEEVILLDRVLSISPGVEPESWLDAYKKILEPLPPGVYELIVHLGYESEELQGATWDHPDWGAAWRQADFSVIRSSEFQEFLHEEGFILINWQELAQALPSNYGPAR